jgi:hypothetical protein
MTKCLQGCVRSSLTLGYTLSGLWPCRDRRRLILVVILLLGRR